MGLMVEIWGVDRKILYYEGSYNVCWPQLRWKTSMDRTQRRWKNVFIYTPTKRLRKILFIGGYVRTPSLMLSSRWRIALREEDTTWKLSIIFYQIPPFWHFKNLYSRGPSQSDPSNRSVRPELPCEQASSVKKARVEKFRKTFLIFSEKGDILPFPKPNR